jgi:hypothetical protein
VPASHSALHELRLYAWIMNSRLQQMAPEEKPAGYILFIIAV